MHGANRKVRRVDPLPRPLRLSADRAAESRLHRRMVFVALADQERASMLRRALQEQPGVAVLPAPSRLFVQGVDQPWLAFHLQSDVGLPALVSAAEFLTSLRRLCDDLFAPAMTGAELLVDWSPEHATPAAIDAIRGIYPDALVVTDSATAAGLTEPPITSVLVSDGSAEQLLAALPSVAGSVAPAPGGSADPLRDRLIVIAGCGRSGTTWLEELWLSHPDVGGLARTESWLFHQLRHLWRTFSRTDGVGPSAWLDRAAFVTALRTYCDGIFSTALARHRPGASYFVEKTPAHAERLPEIAAVYPDAWVVHLVRDGRDVARSISQVPFFEMPDVGAAAELWRRVVATVRRDAAVVPRFREVRYEALYADPVGVMGSLFDWVGLPTGPAHRAQLQSAVGVRVSAHAGTSDPVGPGSWRALPPAARADIYWRAGRLLVHDGYTSRRDVWQTRLHPAALRGQVRRARKFVTEARKDPGSSTQGK